MMFDFIFLGKHSFVFEADLFVFILFYDFKYDFILEIILFDVLLIARILIVDYDLACSYKRIFYLIFIEILYFEILR